MLVTNTGYRIKEEEAGQAKLWKVSALDSNPFALRDVRPRRPSGYVDFDRVQLECMRSGQLDVGRGEQLHVNLGFMRGNVWRLQEQESRHGRHRHGRRIVDEG